MRYGGVYELLSDGMDRVSISPEKDEVVIHQGNNQHRAGCQGHDETIARSEKTSMQHPAHAHARAGLLGTMLMLVVQLILAGVKIAVLLAWLVSRVSDGLGWLVEVGMLFLQSSR